MTSTPSTTTIIPAPPVVPWAESVRVQPGNELDRPQATAYLTFDIRPDLAEGGGAVAIEWDLSYVDGQWVPDEDPMIVADDAPVGDIGVEQARGFARALLAAADALEEIRRGSQEGTA